MCSYSAPLKAKSQTFTFFLSRLITLTQRIETILRSRFCSAIAEDPGAAADAFLRAKCLWPNHGIAVLCLQLATNSPELIVTEFLSGPLPRPRPADFISLLSETRRHQAG